MISRRLLLILVTTFVVSIVAFAVLAGACALAAALEDPVLARVLRWAAAACLAVFVLDAIVLLGALGLQAVYATPNDEPRREQ